MRTHVLLASSLLLGCVNSPSLDPDAGAGEDFVRHTFSDATARALVCNDGSPAGYQLRRGSGEGSETWVIYFQGGKFCDSIASCQARYQQAPELMSSNGRGQTPPESGLLSLSTDDNPDFATANHVVIPYCSSDLWSGDREASAESGGWHFRGRRIAAAVIAELADPALTAVPNLASARQVLVAGSSAGGVGALLNADVVTAQLPGVRVAALDDAGWFQDLDPLSGSALRERLQGAVALWGGRPDDDCTEANPGAEWRCYFGAYALPFLTTPLFGYMALVDKNLMNEVAGTPITPPPTSAQQAFITRFAASVKSGLDPLDGAFAPKVIEHTAASSSSFWTVELDGESLRSLLGNWFFQRGGPTKLIAPL